MRLSHTRWLRAAGPPFRGLALALPALVGLLGGLTPGLAPAAHAHELGAFQVYGSFQLGGAFRLDIKVDDEHLWQAELGGPARVTRYGRIAGLAGPTEQRFGRFLSDLADSLTLAFDGTAVTPTLAMDPEAAAAAGGGAPARATLRVAGWIPGGARAFTFKSSLPIKAYPLVLSCEGDEASTWRWVAGGQTSPPYPLAARVVPPSRAAVARRGFELGFAGILPHGPTALLLVAAMFLLARGVSGALLELAAFALGQALGLALALYGTVLVRPALIAPLLALSVACLAGVCLAAPRPRAWPASLPPSREPSGSPPGSLPASRPPSRESPGSQSGARPVWRPGRQAARPPVELLAAVAAIGMLCGLDLARPFAASTVPPLLPASLAGLEGGASAAELAVMAAAFALVGLPFGDKPWYRTRVVVPACCLIALVGLYWSLSGLLS
jgi:hypothetical protein